MRELRLDLGRRHLLSELLAAIEIDMQAVSVLALAGWPPTFLPALRLLRHSPLLGVGGLP